MSRIIPAKDVDPNRVVKLDLERRATPPPNPSRPAGGIRWIKGNAPAGGEALSEHERRRAEAKSILEKAKADADGIQREAYHKGFEQGEAAGLKLAAQKAEVTIQSLQALLDSLAAEREPLIEQHQTELIRLAMLIATKIIHREIQASEDAVLSVARDALAKVADADSIVVAVSPYDLELMQEQMSQSEQGGAWSPSKMKLEADFDIGRGGCKVTTETGEIDATIETQIELLKSILWNE